MLLSAEYNCICLSLVHHLQAFITSTDIDGKHSMQTEQDKDSKLSRLLWNSQRNYTIAWSLWRRLGHINLCAFLVHSILLCFHCSSSMLHIISASTPSPFHLFRCFAIPSEPVMLPPTTINKVTHAEKIIYSDDSLWHKPIHTPNIAKQ